MPAIFECDIVAGSFRFECRYRLFQIDSCCLGLRWSAGEAAH